MNNDQFSIERKAFESIIKYNTYPYSISVEATAFCNLKCIMCSNAYMKRKKGYMSLDLFKKIATDAAEFFPESHFWMNGYGEPLLNPNFINMVEFASSLGLETYVNTNGMLLTNEMVEKLFNAGLGHIVCSIDGFSPKTYESIRKGGDRNIVYQNIINALRKKEEKSYSTDIEVQIIIMPETESEVDEWESFWKAQGAGIKLKSYATWGGTVEQRTNILNERYACGDSNVLDILWDGRVPFCSTGDVECEYQLGDVKKESLYTIWENKLNSFCVFHETHQFDKLPSSCRKCTDWMTMPAKHE